MSDLKFNLDRDSSGFSAGIIRSDTSRSSHISVYSGLLSSSAFGAQSRQFSNAIEDRVQEFSKRAHDYTNQGFISSIKPDDWKVVKIEFNEFRNSAIKHKNDISVKLADFAVPKFPADERQASLRSELRERAFSVKPAQSFDAAMRNTDLAAAIAEAGEAHAILGGWTPDLWTRFMDHFREDNLAQRIAVQYRLTPTATDPLRDGPDVETARVQARAHLAAIRNSLDEIEAVRAVLISTVDFVALTSDRTREAAFELLMSA